MWHYFKRQSIDRQEFSVQFWLIETGKSLYDFERSQSCDDACEWAYRCGWGSPVFTFSFDPFLPFHVLIVKVVVSNHSEVMTHKTRRLTRHNQGADDTSGAIDL